MNDNCSHVVYSENGIVFISNDNDSWYTEAFKSRLAVDIFIKLIQVVRDEAFPKERENEISNRCT